MDPQSSLVGETDLHAFVDGELTPERRRQVEDHILLHRDDAAKIENWRRQSAAMRAAFDYLAQETPPLSLRNAAARHAADRAAPIESGAIHWGRPSASFVSARRADPRRQGSLGLAVNLLAGAVIAVAAIALLQRLAPAPSAPPSTPLLTQGYVDRANVTYQTYARAQNPVELDAARKDDLASALAARVGFSVAPDLTPLGLRLLGARVAPGLKAPAGLLIYEDAKGARVALLFERAEPAPFSFLAPRLEQGLLAVEWRGAGMAFVLIGPLEPEPLQRAAERAAAEIFARAPIEPAKP